MRDLLDQIEDGVAYIAEMEDDLREKLSQVRAQCKHEHVFRARAGGRNGFIFHCEDCRLEEHRWDTRKLDGKYIIDADRETIFNNRFDFDHDFYAKSFYANH